MPHHPVNRAAVRAALVVECLEDRSLLSASHLSSLLDLGHSPNLPPGLVRLITNLIEVHDNAPGSGADHGRDWLSDNGQRDEDKGKDKNDKNTGGKKDNDLPAVVSKPVTKVKDVVDAVSPTPGTGAAPLSVLAASKSIATPTTSAASPANPISPASPAAPTRSPAAVEPPLPILGADAREELAAATAISLAETEQSFGEGVATAPRETNLFSMEKDLARSTLPQLGAGWSFESDEASRLAGSYSDSEVPLVVSDDECDESMPPPAPQGEVPMVADLMAANAFGIAPDLDGLLDRLNRLGQAEVVEASGAAVPGWLVAAALALASCEVARRQMRRAGARDTDSEPSISWSLSFSGTGSSI